VLDMQPSNSMVRWAVDQGHTVFLISWVNPNGETRDKTFDDYLLEGPLDGARRHQGRHRPGGSERHGLLPGRHPADRDARLAGGQGPQADPLGHFMTTLVDYSDVGDIKVFVTEELVDRLEAVGRAKGFIPGDNVSWGFRMLRAPDLIWTFIINHYLLGKPRMPFDLLYWNEDATNMPAACHVWFMRNMYLKNLLRRAERAGGCRRVDRRHEDHHAVLRAGHARRPHRAVEDLLRDHPAVQRAVPLRAGQLRPHRRRHQPADQGEVRLPRRRRPPPDAEEWFAVTEEQPGSWWLDWGKWLKKHAGGQVKARQPGSTRTTR
jgi:polyhydroxyalkanoate synthase subunit PhaC